MSNNILCCYLCGNKPRDEKGEVTGDIVLMSDITKLKKAEEAISYAEQKWTSLIQNTEYGIDFVIPKLPIVRRYCLKLSPSLLAPIWIHSLTLPPVKNI